jgi:hypothetical protein
MKLTLVSLVVLLALVGCESLDLNGTGPSATEDPVLPDDPPVAPSPPDAAVDATPDTLPAPDASKDGDDTDEEDDDDKSAGQPPGCRSRRHPCSPGG